MEQHRAETSSDSGEQVGTSRRSMLIGATSIAAATAMVSSLGAGRAGAAPPSGSIICDMPTIGTFALDSFQWGAGLGVSSPRGGDRTTSEPSVSEITTTKVTDDASTGLFQALLQGRVIPQATITFSLGRDTPTISLVIDEVIVSGYSISSGGDAPSESLSLNFTAFELTINDSTLDYDLATNQVG